MFFLSLVVFLWTLSVFCATFLSWLNEWWKDSQFVLQRAEIVLVNDAHEATPVERVSRVDVTQDLQPLTQKSARKWVLLPRLLTGRPELADRLVQRSLSPVSSDPRMKKAPLCFLDIRYTYAWSSDHTTYRCLYPLTSMMTKITYPPHGSVSALPSSWSDSALASAMLTLRCAGEGGSSRRLSCDVTERLKVLAGPRGDYHRHSQAAYQLQKHILKVVLMPDIEALQHVLEEDDGDAGVLVEASSSNSLKSLGRSGQAPLPVTVRVQFRKANHDVRVMQLET